jgi:hypothetical protein
MELNEKNLNLAHIFVHFFKIGGGENYLYNFNKYNYLFNETLFINKNYSNETLFNFNLKIIYYDNYEELNHYLKDFDIIIDHQLYWFPLEITIKAFHHLNFNKIIRITHGVPIHQQNINQFNYYYSIELYNDINSHISWNNHIKLYNNIGVKKINLKKIKNTNNIHVSIIGRIYEDKIPFKFLKLLLKFISIYKNYIFNFYGVIDDYYLKILKNINFFNIPNIKYHGIINPEFIHEIYINTDILVHPSKMEAGATVILEAMSYGIPIIARKNSGILNALGKNNDKYLFLKDEELFQKLLLINNYYDQKNILKILNYNNEKYLYLNLINNLKIIYDYECDHNIPNIIHYIYGLKIQNEEFPFIYFLSILSNYLINQPKIIYFHYQYEPHGYWWEKSKKFIQLNYINASDLFWGSKKIIKFAHKADKLRLDILLKYGGIYMDIDTITYKPYHHLLNYDFVIGIQEENYEINKITLYCNAILFSKKNSLFIKEWIKYYEEYFDPNGWCEASVHLPHKILNIVYNKENIKIMSKETFYYPSYNETYKIFENNENIHNDLLTLHYWNSYSNKYYISISNFNYIYQSNSMFSNILKNIINNYLKINICTIEKNEKISILYIYDKNILDLKNLLHIIINKLSILYIDIEFIIIDNGIKNFYNKFINIQNDFKYFDFKIIELYEEVNNNIVIDIGIKFSNYSLINLLNNENILINIENNNTDFDYLKYIENIYNF